MSPLLLALLLLPRPAAAADAAPLDKYFCEDTAKPFFAQRPPGSGDLFPQREPVELPPFRMPKPGGISRIFIAGESAASIIGQRPSAGRAGIEVINCGMGGYESSRILGVVKEVLAYAPDLVAVLSGNNEGSPEPCPGAAYELERRKRKLFERYYSFRNGRARGERLAALRIHEGRLRKMARLAKKKGVPLVLCTLPANMKDMPPDGQLPYGNRAFFEGLRLFWKGSARAAFGKFDLALAALPADPFINYFAARSLAAAGDRGGADNYFTAALERERRTDRRGREVNDLISRVAREEGACVADLDALFRKIAGGQPGFDEFLDQVHWRPAYNQAVMREILRAGAACGYRLPDAELPREDMDSPGPAAADSSRLSYAVSWISKARESLSEPALAQLAFLLGGNSPALRAAERSPEGMYAQLVTNFWFKPPSGAGFKLYPALLAHLSELQVRAGKTSAAIKLADKGLALAPGMKNLLFVRARALAEAGSAVAARREFCGLAAAEGAESPAAALAVNYGYEPCPAPEKNSAAGAGGAKSKEFSDAAVTELAAGRLLQAEAFLQKAIAADPSNPEARMTFCSLRSRQGREAEAAEECLRAAEAALAFDDGRQPALRALAVNAYLERARLLEKAGRGAQALESRRLALEAGAGTTGENSAAGGGSR